MTTKHYTISAAQRRTYAADGALFLPGVLDAARLSRLKTSVEQLESRESREGRPSGFFDRQRLWEQDEHMRDIVFASPAATIAAQFLDVDTLNLLYDQIFIKEPASNVRTPWHNDLPNWPVRGTQLITVWVALDSINEKNGMLEFVRGSHLWDRWTPRPHTDIDGRLTHFHLDESESATQEEMQADYADVESAARCGEILRWETQPGDAVVFGALTVHGAAGNAGAGMKRRAYSMRFAGPDVRYQPLIASNTGIMNDALAPGDPAFGCAIPHRLPGLKRCLSGLNGDNND